MTSWLKVFVCLFVCFFKKKTKQESKLTYRNTLNWCMKLDT